MTEINNNLPASPPSSSSKSRSEPKRPRLTNAQANSMQGLASGLNTKQIIETIMQVERQRLEPVEARREETQIELDAYTKVSAGLQTLQATAQILADREIWEGKLVESSNEAVVTATATTGAKPGKNTMIVEKLALNNQIASQTYEDANADVGTGNFKITVGEEAAVTVVVDDSNSTLTGLKDSINGALKDARATIINTGDKERPYQLVITSQKTGTEGRLTLEIDMNGGEPPNFTSTVGEPSEWAGVKPKEKLEAGPSGTGASTTIVQVVGVNTAEDEHEFTFTAVQTGSIGGENALQMRWNDESGRSGALELDNFNYAPGEPVEFADGLSLVFSQGDVIVGDQFSVSSSPKKSALLWWLSDEEAAPVVSRPAPWERQAEFGAPMIEGNYTGEDDQEFTLTVQGSGQVGSASDLSIRWESEDGKSGTARVGKGYQPGTQLAIIDGLTMSLNPGVLADGAIATFATEASDSISKWWLDDAEREIPGKILNVTSFESPEIDEDRPAPLLPEIPFDRGGNISTTKVLISGTYTGDESKVYTFTATNTGSVGTTKNLVLRWEDDKGGSGELTVGEGYAIDSPLPFDSGLAVSFGSGRIFKEDTFSLRTRTSTIQPAQDALLRFGATELGGGIEVTNSTNELSGVIEGVRLNLVSVSEKPVTITVTGDTEKAAETIIQFGNEFNQVAVLINELTKFDPDTQEAGPLLGDHDLTLIRSDLTQLVMDPVAGLPTSRNMLFGLGLELDDKGVLKINEETIREEIAEDFAGVADVFRAKGVSDNTAVSFVNMTEDTLGNPDGYEVDITRGATRGSYLTPPFIAGPITVTEQNDNFVIVVDGVRSEEITVQPGQYDLEEFARQLQNGITNDEIVGERRVRVTSEGDRIRITSARYGSRSSLAFEGPGGVPAVFPGLSGGESEEGLNTEGFIDGEPAEGIGQLLKGSDDSKRVKGLRLIVDLPSNMVIPSAPEATIKITKGVGSKLAKHIKDLQDPRTGNMQRITSTLRSAVGNIDGQLEQMNERIERKRGRLQEKFARMEGKLSSLKSQQKFMSGQLPAGGGGGTPGLPGL